MDYHYDLKAIVQVVSLPPFSKSWSIIDLGELITPSKLLDFLLEISYYIGEHNDDAGPSSNLTLGDKIPMLIDLLILLKFKPSLNYTQNFVKDLTELRRNTVLSTMTFLLCNIVAHKKRVYLASYLLAPDVPAEFALDHKLSRLIDEIETAQSKFKDVHRNLESHKKSGLNTGLLKREILQMENDRQNLLQRVSKIQSNAQAITNTDQWLRAAQSFRLEQQNELSLHDRLRDQKIRTDLVDRKLASTLKLLKLRKTRLLHSSPITIFAKFKEEHQTNKFLATDNFPILLGASQENIVYLNQLKKLQTASHEDIKQIQIDIGDLNRSIHDSSERRINENYNAKSNLMLLRQQATTLCRQKEGLLSKITARHENIFQLQNSKINAVSNSKFQGLDGAILKKYVTELREKSILFKEKKGMLSTLSSKADSTRKVHEDLIIQYKLMNEKVKPDESKESVAGHLGARENLQKLPTEKFTVDYHDQLERIVGELEESANSQGGKMGSSIENLKNIRQQVIELQESLSKSKYRYLSVMQVIDADATKLSGKLLERQSQFKSDEARYHNLVELNEQADIAQKWEEVQSYSGADTGINKNKRQNSASIQTKRDLYGQEIKDLEKRVSMLDIAVEESRNIYESSMNQKKLFEGVKKILTTKISCNKKYLTGNADRSVQYAGLDQIVMS